MKKKIIISLALTVYSLTIFAQTNHDMIMQAMKDELNRNIEELSLPGLEKPFYISYTLGDLEIIHTGASLGSIIQENSENLKSQNTFLLVGNYLRANNNYYDVNTLYRRPGNFTVPDECSYTGIRRIFWKSTDNNYKAAAETYAAKQSAIQNQNLPQNELEMPDYSTSEVVKSKIPKSKILVNTAILKDMAVETSTVFTNYPEITDSYVSTYFYSTYIYFVNSEGTEVSYPLTFTALMINAETIADDGKKLFDHLHYFSLYPHQLPDIKEISESAHKLAKQLIALSNAPVFDDYYSGPVLFENEAVSEYIIQQVFGENNSLIARRKPILQNEQVAMMLSNFSLTNRLEARINRRITDRSISIISDPSMNSYDNIFLIGSYPFDAEGVAARKAVLVEDGILKSFLHNRVPTRTSEASNASQRLAIQHKTFRAMLAPGVIKLESSETSDKEELRKKLIEIARDEDLDYAIIIRKFEYDISERKDEGGRGSAQERDMMSRPLYIYKVDLNDGTEELIRSADVSGMNLRSLNRISGVSGKEFVYNGLKKLYSRTSTRGAFQGIPVSIISPEAILFNELEILKETSSSTQRLPVVESPLTHKK
jgi:hypothetical protein